MSSKVKAPKKNGNKSSQALVTLQNGPVNRNGNGKKKRTKQVTNGVRIGYSATRDNFLLALVSPFCPEAYGIRVPDPFPFPTVTHHIRQTTVIGSQLGTLGAVAFLPSPVLSMIDLTSITVGALSVISTPMTKFGATGAPVSMYKATTVTAMNNVYASYRCVAWGIKISNLQPELSATGRIIVAMVPIGDSVPSENELNNVNNTSTATTPIFGTPVNNLATSGLLQLPSAQQFAVQDLLHGDLEVSGMYTNTSFWQFKTTDTQGLPFASHRSGDSITVNTGTGVTSTSGYKDPNRMMGGCAIVVYYEGLPTATPNAFQIETIYHLEGSPQISTTASTIPVPSGAEKVIVGTTDLVDKAMGVASKLENVFTFITKGADFLNRNTTAIDKIAALASTAKYIM